MSLSISVIDCIYGRSAIAMPVRLSREIDGVFAEQWHDQTDDRGSISGLHKPPLPPGSYTLEFDLEAYFRTLGYASFHSSIMLRFHVPSEAHVYELSLLVTPSTCVAYRVS
jgi:5-hydroxyisourate hydrolase-like protein (transthyretin family)